jgi:signal transduction histidine kinase
LDEARYREMVELVRRTRHDANSPITAALGHTQLLLDEPGAQDPEVQESLRVVEKELRRLIDILGRLKEVRSD